MENTISNFTFFEKSSSSRGGASSFSIVNTNENGKRLKFSKKALEILDNPEIVKIGFNETEVMITEGLNGNKNCFKLSKRCLYDSVMVLKMTELFNLDFSDGRTSLSFNEDRVEDLETGKKAIVFKMI